MNESEKRALWAKMKAMFARWNFTDEERELFLAQVPIDEEGVIAVVEYDAAHLTDGFRPRTHAIDDLVARIKTLLGD